MLPDDLLRAIWARHWQEEAACAIQIAVRAAIAREWGNVWVRPEGYFTTQEKSWRCSMS